MKHTWSFQKGALHRVEEVADRILAERDFIEGVTFLGGEPFAQAGALSELGSLIKAKGLSIVTFTGYYLGDLQKSRRREVAALLAVTDLLIDGPFRESEREFSRPWVGSRNQGFHFLSERYRGNAKEILGLANKLEIRVSKNGAVTINGLAPLQVLEGFANVFS